MNVTPVPDLPFPFQKQIVFHILLWFGAYARYFAEQKLVLVNGRVPHPICYCDFPPPPRVYLLESFAPEGQKELGELYIAKKVTIGTHLDSVDCVLLAVVTKLGKRN